MITSIKGKEVNVTWKEGQLVQTFRVEAIDLMNDWICLRNLEKEEKTVFWARLEDIDAVEVLTKNYNPDEPDGFFGANGEMPMGVSPSMMPDVNNPSVSSGQGGSSFMKVSMEYLLPQASADFYMASNSQNAFSAIYKMMTMLDRHVVETDKGKKKEMRGLLNKIRGEANEILKEFHVDFDEDESDEGQDGQKESNIV